MRQTLGGSPGWHRGGTGGGGGGEGRAFGCWGGWVVWGAGRGSRALGIRFRVYRGCREPLAHTIWGCRAHKREELKVFRASWWSVRVAGEHRLFGRARGGGEGRAGLGSFTPLGF